MSGGRIVEQGKHAQLMENSSTYYQMVKQQNMGTESKPSIDTTQESTATDLEKTMAQVSNTSRDESEKASTGHTLASEQNGPKSSDSFSSLARFVFNLNRGDLAVMVGGLLLSIVAGASHPTYVCKQCPTLWTTLPPLTAHPTDKLSSWPRTFRRCPFSPTCTAYSAPRWTFGA